jgi:hypothetical protein
MIFHHQQETLEVSNEDEGKKDEDLLRYNPIAAALLTFTYFISSGFC